MFSMSLRRRSRPGLNHLVLIVASGSALAIGACTGPAFSPCASGSCEPSGEGGGAGTTEPTPSPAGNAGQAEQGTSGADDGGAGSGGRGDSGAAGEATGGVPTQGQGGESAGAGGDDASVAGHAGAPSAPCVENDDCSNDDPTDGEERCNAEHVCVAGNAPPFVVSVSPERSAMDQDPSAPIELEFSEKLAPGSITHESLIVEAGGERVPGSVAYAGVTATFTPRHRFPLRGLVTVKVDDTVTDLAGAKMLDAFSSGFWIRDGEWTAPMTIDTIAPARTGRHVPIDASGNVLVTFVRSAESVTDKRAFSRFYHPGVGLSAFVEHAESITPAAMTITGALNEHGLGSVIWRQSAQYAYGCFSREYRDRQWSAAPASRSFEAISLATAVSPLEDVHFATGQTFTTLTRCSAEGTCSGNSGTPSDGKEGFPAFAFDAQGNAIAAWRRAPSAQGPGGIVVAHYSAETQAWQPGTLLDNPRQAEEPTGSQPNLAVSPDGSALVVWVEQGAPDSGGVSAEPPRLLLASHYTPESGWSQALTLASNLGDIDLFSPAVAFDGRAAVVAWVASAGAAHVYTLGLGGETIETPERRDDTGVVVRRVMPQLGSDRAGNLLLTWLEIKIGGGHRLAYQRRVDGIWSSTEYLSDFLNPSVEDATLDPAVQVGVGATGVAAVLWEQRSAAGVLEALSLSVFE
jgi:hypothetical protein